MKSYLYKSGVALSTVGFVLTLVLSLSISFFGYNRAQAAPPASLTISGSQAGTNVECRIVMSNDSEWFYHPSWTDISGFPLLTDQISSNASLSADYSAVMDAGFGSSTPSQLVYLRLVAINEGSSGANQRTCGSGGIFFSRPSDPTRFFGFYNNATLRQPYYVPPITGNTGQILFPAGQRAVAYSVTADQRSEGILTNPIFSLGSNPSVGFCSQYDVSGLENLRSNCMRAAVQSFNAITYRGETYTLRAWGGNNMYYDLTATDVSTRSTLAASTPGTCKPYFRLSTDGNSGYDINVDGDANSGDQGDVLDELKGLPSTANLAYQDYTLTCSGVAEVSVVVNSFTNLRQMFAYVRSANTIIFEVNNPGGNESRLITGNGRFTVDPTNPLRFNGVAKSDGCSTGVALPRIDFSVDPTTHNSSAPLSATWYFPINGDCDLRDTPILVRFVPADSAETLDTIDSSTGAVDGGADEAAQEPVSTCSSEGGALGWILCPVLTVLDETTTFLESQLREFLFIDPSQFTTDGEVYKAWSVFRSIATVIIVIIALIMIFSQAMGAGIFDNYSVKKLLPRLLIAGIGIQLSWFALVQLINVSNILGDGIGGLIGSPFDITPETKLSEELGSITSQASGGDLFTGLVTMGALGFVLIGSIVPLAIGVVAALFVGLITLIVRNMIVLLGVVLAPVAIAMSVLPGTQKTSKLWWESLEKALLLYPIIIALLMSGKIIATLLFASAGTAPNIKMVPVIAGIIAWYAPFFFLPKALQAGGAALGKISGLAGDKSKGMFDKANTWNGSRKDARKKFNRGIRDSRLATTAAGIGVGASVARARIRGRSGQNISGKAFRQDKSNAQDRSFEKLQDGIFKQEADDADTLLRTASFTDGKGQKQLTYGSSDELKKIATDGNKSRGERQAAVNRLVTLGADGSMREIENASKSDAVLGNIYTRTRATGDFAGAFKDKAPDLVKGNSVAFGNATSSGSAAKWSKQTWEKAYQEGTPNLDNTARELANDNQLWRDVSPDVREILAKRGVAPNSTTESTTVGPSVSPVSSAPAQQPTPKDRISSASSEEMGNWVSSVGGHGSLSKLELAQIANSGRGDSHVQDAKDEIARRKADGSWT